MILFLQCLIHSTHADCTVDPDGNRIWHLSTVGIGSYKAFGYNDSATICGVKKTKNMYNTNRRTCLNTKNVCQGLPICYTVRVGNFHFSFSLSQFHIFLPISFIFEYYLLFACCWRADTVLYVKFVERFCWSRTGLQSDTIILIIVRLYLLVSLL